MKKILTSLVLQYVFLMVFFALLRAVFLVYHIPTLRLEGAGFWETTASFWHAFKLDTATTGYLLVLPSMILTFQGLTGRRFLNIGLLIYYFLVVLAWSVVTVAELGIYSEWKSKLTTAAFIHLRNPAEVYYTASAFQFFGLIALGAVLTILSFLLFRKVFYVRITQKFRPWYLNVVFFLLILPILFLVLRGGFNAIPISQSAAHYSHHSTPNWAAVNSGYHLAVNILETNRYKNYNAYGFFDDHEAKAAVDELLAVEKDTTLSILKIERPNVVMIILESWTADVIESLGAEPGITPQFAAMEKDGLLFTEFYCTGNRSHEAMATILGGHPALPYTTFTENAEKYRNMPSMVRILNDSGYHTSFYFGGELNYGNLRAYGLFNRFAKIVEERDLDPGLPRGRLGVHDEFLYAHHIREMENIDAPFFSMVFTMSSHSPYDFPMEPVIDWAGTFNPFLNSVYYADRCLGEYFEMARKQPWYDSTLFILVADHGHASHKNWRYESYEYHRVPLLFYGEVLREEYRGVKTDRISDNSALPKTILKQLNMPSEAFRWSVDLFNPYSPEYAYMVLKNGYTWKTREGEIVYSFKWQHFYKKQFPEGTSRAQEDEFIRMGKSYVQELFREFLAM